MTTANEKRSPFSHHDDSALQAKAAAKDAADKTSASMKEQDEKYGISAKANEAEAKVFR